MNSKQAKNIAIETYLARQGFTPEREQGNYLWYRSPLRNERTPSFRVNRAFNSWFDYGIGKGGNILDLAMEMLQTEDLSRCLAHLESLQVAPFSFAQQKKEFTPPESSIIVTQVQPLSSPALLDYLGTKRGINIDIAREYCREVHYVVNGKPYFAVGFQSDGGGFELRNEYFKGGTSPKGITTIGNGSDTVMLFEGFMDMLSYLTLKNVARPSVDMVVLNSVVNLSKASEFFKRHQTTHCFLDNDEAGKRALKAVQKLGREVVDQSAFYSQHKDLNEYLVSRKCDLKIAESTSSQNSKSEKQDEKPSPKPPQRRMKL